MWAFQRTHYWTPIILDGGDPSCDGRGFKKEAAICVDVCPCHTIFVSYDDCGDRAFFVAAPCVWNTLPSSVTASETLGTFKRRLKTHLFATSFP